MKLYICCSASNNIPQNIIDDCKILLNKLLKENDLVFGAGDTGLMGISYEIAKKNNRKVTGICPTFYKEKLKNLNCDKEIITNEMLDSTLKIIKNSDAIIVLPGGFGTIYEIFTAIQSKICDEHNLPIIIYNSCNYYDELIKFIEETYKLNFAKENIKEKYVITNNKEEMLNIIKNI